MPIWSNHRVTTDLLVCGLGPAGRALAHRALARGLAVTAIDPHPQRHWTATYGAWADELPDWLNPAVVGATVERPVAWTTRRYELDRRYVVFDTAALQDSLEISGARVLADEVVTIGPRARLRAAHSVRLASGAEFSADRVIDARGIPRSPARAEQTAYGLVLDRARCADLEPHFMDWRLDNGADPAAPRSFLYAVPLDEHSMLLEETCLAGRPALENAVLRDRLRTRLRSRGIEFTSEDPIERVRFPVTGGRPGRRGFGAAGALTHPATGYSVATALATADTVAAGATLWSPSARAVQVLRGAGLRALLALPPADLPVFFDAFFALPPALQRAYLSGRTDLAGTAAAMRTLFAALPPRMRVQIAAATVGFPVRSRIRMGSAIME